jgi:DNA mismatch repair protein MutS2
MKMKKSKKQNSPELDQQECELFLNAFYQGEIKKAPEKKGALEISDDKELFLRALENLPLGHEKTIKKAVFKKAKKKKIIDAKIDLHGMFVEEALRNLNFFLQQELKKGSKKLLVVHGKGSGALRNAVWAYIESHREVDDFQVAIGKMGGEGALLVRINQKRKA